MFTLFVTSWFYPLRWQIEVFNTIFFLYTITIQIINFIAPSGSFSLRYNIMLNIGWKNWIDGTVALCASHQHHHIRNEFMVSAIVNNVCEM